MKNLKAIIVGIAILTAIILSGMVNAKVQAATIEQSILSQINSVREKEGLSKLIMDAELSEAARIRVDESSFLFGHNRPDGSGYYTVNNSIMGENLYRGDESFSPSTTTVSMWDASKVHHEVMTTEYVSKAGIAIKHADGMYYVVLVVG